MSSVNFPKIMKFGIGCLKLCAVGFQLRMGSPHGDANQLSTFFQLHKLKQILPLIPLIEVQKRDE